MAEEGLVIPTFGLDPEADNHILPDFDRAAPARPVALENPGLGFLGNLRGAFRGSTITGAAAEAETARLARGGTPTREELIGDPVGAGAEGLALAPLPELTDERARDIRDAARDQMLEQLAYDLAPTKVSGAGIAGQIAGQVLDPLNLATFGGGMAASRLAAAGFGKAAQAAATMGVQAGATDLAVQGIRTTSGAQEHFEPLEAALAPVAGALLGAGGHALMHGAGAVGGLLKENLKAGVGSVAEFIRARAAQRDALGVDLPREALAGTPEARTEGPAPQPAAVSEQSGQSAATALGTAPPARTDLPAEPLREAEPARGMPAAEPDPTAPVSREQTAGRAEGPPPGEEPIAALPPVPAGHVRMYHGGEEPTAGGARWATPDPAYARNFGEGGKLVHYVDVPEDHPALVRTVPDEDVAAGVPQSYGNSELPEDVARGFRPVGKPRAPGETFEARGSRLAAERDALAEAGPDNTPGGRELHDALASVDSPRNEDPTWAARHVDEALALGRRDIADHLVEGAERRAVEAERVADETTAAQEVRDAPGTRYAAAVVQEDAEQARNLADGLRQRVEGRTGRPDDRQADTGSSASLPGGTVAGDSTRVQAPDRRTVDEPSPNAAPREPGRPGLVASGLDDADRVKKRWRAETPYHDADAMLAAAPANQRALGEAGRAIAEELGVTFKDPGVKAVGREVIAAVEDEATRAKRQKGLDRFLDKVGTKKPGTVTDLVRAGFDLTSPEQGDAILARLAERFEVIDEGWFRTPDGYFDRKVYVRFADGMLGELQMWEPSLLERKSNGGHALYEEARQLQPGDPRLDALKQRMADHYRTAFDGLSPEWRAAVEGSGGSSAPNLALKRSGDSSAALWPTSTEFASTQALAPSGSTNAGPGPIGYSAGSPSSEQSLKPSNIGGASTANISSAASSRNEDRTLTSAAMAARSPRQRPRDLIAQPVPGLGEHRVSAPGMEPIRVAPVVVEAADLRTSADAGFDRALQPRQRERAASQEQIRDIAANLEPERLGVSTEADRGAPIVGADRMVESGNGRVLALRRVYEQGGEAADRYRAWLAGQGVDVSAYREPVLVRQRLTPLTAEQRRGFTDAANRAATLAMSAPERAMADARLVTPDSLDLIRNANDLGATANREFVRSFTARLPQAERGAMVTAEGGLSSEGLARVRNAVLARAYDHAGVLSRIAEATSDDVKSISNALVAVAPDWAKLRADIARGAVREDVDLTGELLEAVTRTADLRAKGVKLDTFLAQQDAFDRLPRPVEAFMRMFYDERGRRAAGAPVVAERLRAYAGEARKVLADQGLDLGLPRVSAEEIQAAAARRGQRAPEGEGALLFSRRQPTDPRQVSFFDRVAEGLRNAEPEGGTKRAGEAVAFLRGLGTEMADRAGREGPEAAGAGLDRVAATEAEEDSFLGQLGRAVRADAAEASDIGRPAPGVLVGPETDLVEAATRLHGAPAERTIPLEELRAALPGQSAAEFDATLAELRARGVAQVTDRGVRLDPAAVRQAQQAAERYVGEEAASIGRELFGAAPEILERRRKAPAGASVDEPDMIRQGRPVEDQGTPALPGDARPERLEAMGRDLAAAFETVLRTGRVQPGARGQFDTRTGVARIRDVSDLGTAVHELGHSLQQSAQTAPLVDPLIARHRAELAPLGAGTGKTGDAEAFAELFRLYATNRAYAARTYPGATADLERTLAADLPRQAVVLDRLRADLDALHRAPSGAVVGSDVITPPPSGLFRRMLDLLGADFIGAATADPRGGVFYAWRDALYTNFLSPHHPINRAVYALGRVARENTGRGLDLLPQDDPYILARISSGARAVADNMLSHGVRGARSDENAGPSFRDAIEAAIGKRYKAGQWHDFGAYLTARRMVAEYERFAAGEIANPPGKLSAGDYARAVQEFEAKYPTFADGADKYYAFNRNLLQRHYDLGLFTKEYYDAAMARKDYAPLMRDMEDLGQAAGSGAGGKRDGASMMKTFRGSQRSVVNPLDSTVKKVHDLEQAAALNETKAALARAAEIAGPGSGFIAEPIPANRLSSVAVDIVDALRAAGSRANVDNLDLGALIHQAEGLLGDDVFTHIFRQEPIRPGREPITFYYVNGERRALRLSDDAFGRALYASLNAMTKPERNVFVSMLQISGALLRYGVTTSLGFVYRNFTRDQGTSVGTGARGYVPFISALKGGMDVVRGGGDFEKYLSFGGFAGGLITEQMDNSGVLRGGAQRMFREKGIVGKALGGGAKLAEFSEAVTRAGQFTSYVKQGRDLGFDDYNAALYAAYKTNDYIDFRKVGAGIAGFARAIPFLNAAAQGTDREARQLFGNMVRLEAKRARGEDLSRIEVDELKDARAAWVKTLGWAMLFGGTTAYLNSDDPQWFGAAEWRRSRGYNLMPFGPEGHWLTVFKPFGFVRNVSDLVEYGVEYLMRGDPTIAGKLGRALVEAHSLPYTNPAIDLFYNTRANYDPFRDRPIVPPSLQALPAAEQYNRYTSEIAKGIGQATGWSPMKVDYVLKGGGGTKAKDFLENTTNLIHWMQGRPGGREKTVWDLPLMRELTQNLAVGSQYTDRFYKLVGEKVGSLEQVASAYGQKINAGDRTGATDYLRRQPEAERAFAVLNKTGFDADERLMHPLLLARAYNAVIGGVSRALGDGNLLPEGDLDRRHLTQSRRDLQPIAVSGPTAEKLRNELDALSMVTARNALIAFGAEGMQGVPVKDPAEFLDRIRMLSPEVARELRGRLAAKRLYDPGTVAERWPEVRARLLKDGEDADLADLLPHRPKSAKRERKRALADD